MKYWLMKAEPESRFVKGKDVKFSVEDFENIKTTPWEGVRNAEARNIMKSMEVGDQVLFYHSSCKIPGIAAFAEISKEAYPDYTAWDPSHPYYDEKTKQDDPKWYMVDVTFKSRAAHFVPLPLLRRIAAQTTDPPSDVEYIGKDGVKAIKEMALINRGRLSVQPVGEKTFNVIQMLADKGGWEETSDKSTKIAKPRTAKRKAGGDKQGESEQKDSTDNAEGQGGEKEAVPVPKTKTGSKRKVTEAEHGEAPALRRSTRMRKG